MSAIGVIFNRDGAPVDPQVFAVLGERLSRLGPDGGEELIAGSVGMTYRALRTTRESHFERQPVTSPQGNILVMDGIVFNRQELIALLRNELRDDQTDAGLVSTGLEHYGIDFLAKIIGNFALAWWQVRNNTLTLARDPFGVRQLFYCVNQSYSICASDLEPLLNVNEVAIDDEYVAGYIASCPEPARTPYQNIRAVAPGEVISVSKDRLISSKFWNPDPHKEIRYKSDTEYEEHLRHELYTAVQCHLRTDGRPIMSCLSGGLDSSTIVCVADQLIADDKAEASKLDTFSLVYEQSTTADERRYIRAVEEKRGRAGFHVCDDEHWINFMPPETVFLRAPSTQICTSDRNKHLLREMDQRGIRVMLDGHGGDQIFWNMFDVSPELTDLLVKGNLLGLHRRLGVWSRVLKKPFLQLLWKQTILPLLPIGVRAHFQPEVSMPIWLNNEFVKRTKLRERWLPPHDSLGLRLPGARIQSSAILQVIRLVAAELYRDRIGIEIRYPFLYRPLIEFLLAIPFEQKLRPGETRSLMRRTLKNELPEKILKRKGKGVAGEVVNRAIVRERNKLEQLFDDPLICRRGYADLAPLRSALRLAMHGGRVDPGALINTIALEIWLRSIEHHKFNNHKISKRYTLPALA